MIPSTLPGEGGVSVGTTETANHQRMTLATMSQNQRNLTKRPNWSRPWSIDLFNSFLLFVFSATIVTLFCFRVQLLALPTPKGGWKSARLVHRRCRELQVNPLTRNGWAEIYKADTIKNIVTSSN